MIPTRRVGLYCRSEVVGGAEMAMLNLAACFSGHQHLVILSPSPEVIDAAARVAPDVERHLIEIADDTRSFSAIRAALRDARLDLLQITLPNPFAERDAQLAAFSLRLPVVTVQQLVLPARRRRGAWVVRLFASLTRVTIAVGERSRLDLIEFFRLPADKVHVVHNGVPAATPEPVEFDRRPVVGCVARFEAQKALHRLVDAMPRLPDARLILLGDGSLRAELQSLAETNGVADRVDVNGWSETARAHIAGFDVFALTSVDEAFPLTIVEAMLAGTPVVATDVGSVSEAIEDGQTGLLVSSGDADALVGAIRRLLDDEAFAGQLAANAHELALRRFTAEITAGRYGDIWDRCSELSGSRWGRVRRGGRRRGSSRTAP